MVVSSGQAHGGADEADLIADEVVAYVDFNWFDLRLHALARYPDAWLHHLQKTATRHWFAKLKSAEQTYLAAETRGRWAESAATRESRARAIIQMRVDAMQLPSDLRAIFDAIYVNGLSVEEAALAFDKDHQELIRSIRSAWAAVKAQFPDLW